MANYGNYAIYRVDEVSFNETPLSTFEKGKGKEKKAITY
jgi:hypothetical protein